MTTNRRRIAISAMEVTRYDLQDARRLTPATDGLGLRRGDLIEGQESRGGAMLARRWQTTVTCCGSRCRHATDRGQTMSTEHNLQRDSQDPARADRRDPGHSGAAVGVCHLARPLGDPRRRTGPMRSSSWQCSTNRRKTCSRATTSSWTSSCTACATAIGTKYEASPRYPERARDHGQTARRCLGNTACGCQRTDACHDRFICSPMSHCPPGDQACFLALQSGTCGELRQQPLSRSRVRTAPVFAQPAAGAEWRLQRHGAGGNFR